MIEWQPKATSAEQYARDVISAVMFLHYTFKDEVWLWRGQAKGTYPLSPGMHTRVQNAKVLPVNESSVNRGTDFLIGKAREARLDEFEGTKLPDLALLAHLQHYGAGTPLLDVTVDPLIALWMLAFSSPEDPSANDAETGKLFGIRKPPAKRHLSALDARPYYTENDSDLSIHSILGAKAWWYEAPDVTERLRIQRGSFILAPLIEGQEQTIPLSFTDSAATKETWLSKRLEKRGSPSNTFRSHGTDVFAIKVRGSAKPFLRRLLIERSGLSVPIVYPTPWHRPYIEQFARTYGRSRPLDFDLKPASGDPI